MDSRINMTFRNAFWSYFSMIASLVIQFISRTVFIYCLGETYLGINGLFSNVLGVLSFAELGIGTAMNYSLYKPVAKGNREKIKSYMLYYKWAYRIIAAVVSVLGAALLPFLPYLVKDPGNVGNIRVYYLIFLFNTVTSYFVSYKYSLVNAEQKNYIYTNVNLVITLTQTLAQIITMVIWHDYLLYLVIGAGFGLFQKIFVGKYLNHLYPYLRDKHAEKLSKEEERTLIQKVKALVIHKIGDISVHQTDNIIVSAFVNVRAVGLISNYNLIIGTVSSCISVLFNSVTGSLGNLVATESKEHQYEVFCVYRFIGFWFYGFTSVALLTLLTPFITLWIGERMAVDEVVIALIVLDYYMIGHRICLNNIKVAAGSFERDKYVALLQAVVNLIASVLLVKSIGLRGVYIGTIMQGAISSVVKPLVTYRDLFGKSSALYFADSLRYGAAVAASLAICLWLRTAVLSVITVDRFAAMMVMVTIVPNLLFIMAFHRRREFQYVWNLGKQIGKKIFRR